MERLLITGYRDFELGIFGRQDPRIGWLKKAIRKALISYLDQGVTWLIFTGQLGFEYWVLEEALDLRADYEFQMACLLLFANHGEQWSEANQEKLARFKQLDFVKVAYSHYENPSQLREFQTFLLDHTDGAYLFYDPDQESKLRYLYEAMRAREGYELQTLTFDDLNQLADD